MIELASEQTAHYHRHGFLQSLATAQFGRHGSATTIELTSFSAAAISMRRGHASQM